MNINTTILTCSIIALISSQQASSDIRIYSTEAQGQTIIFSANERFARMDNEAEKNYALMDFERQQFMLVNPGLREVLILDNTKAPTPMKIDIQLRDAGTGPDIAGFGTTKYVLTANGQKCAVIYGSHKAARLPGMQKLFAALDKLQQGINNMMRGFRPDMDDCAQAKSQAAQMFKTTGTPLRIDNARGQMQSRISRIDSAAEVPLQHYQIPQGFKVTPLQQQLEAIEQEKSKALEAIRRQMPDMQKMIEHMRQQGAMPEEAIEQLRQMKELFKQPAAE